MPQKRTTPSIVEVAAKAGVSIQTVSNVLNFPERVKLKTRERVMSAVESMEYTPNLSARRLRSKKSSSLAVRLDANATVDNEPRGLFTGFIQNDFVFQLVEAADSREIKVVVYTADSPELELMKLKRFIKSRDVDGLILTSTEEKDLRLKFLESHDVPFLSFGRPWGAKNLYSTSHPWIDVDGASGTALATEMFFERGCSSIGYLGWVSPQFDRSAAHSVGDDRFLGWYNTVLQHKLPKRNAGLVGGNDPLAKQFALVKDSVEFGREGVRKLIKSFPKIDAIVCATDTLALGAVLELRQLNLEDILVSGFDNTPVSKEFGFSSLEQNLSLVANSALTVLMGQEGNQIRKVDFGVESTSAHVLLKPKLIIR